MKRDTSDSELGTQSVVVGLDDGAAADDTLQSVVVGLDGGAAADDTPTSVVVGLDADDTLWHCERDFAEIQRQFCEMMAPYMAADGPDAQQNLDAVERQNLAVFGYGSKGFMLSMVESAIQMSDGAVTGDEIQRILDWGKDLLGAGKRGLELLDGVEAALDRLEGRRTIVITKGDLFEQESKVAASGLGERFESVEVVPEKTPDQYLKVLGRSGIDPADLIFIGNSVKSDILPVIEIGGTAILVPYPLEWVHERATFPEDHPRAHRAESLGAAVEIAERLIAARRAVPNEGTT